MFRLDERLERDTVALAKFPLCQLLLMNDSQYPWFILVPQEAGLRELKELSVEQRRQYSLESDAICNLLQGEFAAEKLNVAALGNLVPQLHIHHIGRYAKDPAWPQPVWGVHPPVPYEPSALQERLQRTRVGLEHAGFTIEWCEGN